MVRLFVNKSELICLHTVKRFQLLLSNSNNSISTQLNDFKYKKWLNISIWPIAGTTIGTITPVQSGFGSNGNDWVLHIPKAAGLEPHHQLQFTVIPRTLVEMDLLLFRDTVSVFYNLFWLGFASLCLHKKKGKN